MKKRFTDRFGYFSFTLTGLLLIVTGLLMNVFGYTSSYDIGLKYGPADKSSISGNLVIMLGGILLSAILVFYLVGRKGKARK